MYKRFQSPGCGLCGGLARWPCLLRIQTNRVLLQVYMMQNEPNQTQNNEKDALADFASTALRRNKPGSYEQLLCNHLIKAVTAESIEKIRLVSEAAMMVPDFKHKNLDAIYQVATSFYSTKYNIYKDALLLDPSASWHGRIAWCFAYTEKDYKKYIKPWLKTTKGIWTTQKRQPPKDVNDMEVGEYFFFATTNTHNSTLELLQSRFIVWAIPQTMNILEQLTAFVSPDVYAEMLNKVRQ